MTDTIDRSGTEDDHVLDHLIVRFAGDSGDGMQLTGDRFTSVSAAFGNDLSTLPDFPAEIRAPAGTVNGVSAFQVNIANHKITTPGDAPNVLVAMNPAALRAELHRLEPGGTVLVNTDATATEHGFVAMWPAAESRMGLAWLDGRATALAPPRRQKLRMLA